jgi:hypothetical protein
MIAHPPPALLRKGLVFQVKAGGADLFPQPHGALHAEHAAVAGVGIGEDGQVRRARDAADVLEHLRLAQRAHVGLAGFHTAGDEATTGLCFASAGCAAMRRVTRSESAADKGTANLGRSRLVELSRGFLTGEVVDLDGP